MQIFLIFQALVWKTEISPANNFFFIKSYKPCRISCFLNYFHSNYFHIINSGYYGFTLFFHNILLTPLCFYDFANFKHAWQVITVRSPLKLASHAESCLDEHHDESQMGALITPKPEPWTHLYIINRLYIYMISDSYPCGTWIKP